VHPLRDLLRGRLPTQLLEEAARDPHQLVDGLHHVDRDADGPRLVGDGPGDGLTDPPGGVGAELEPLPVLELLDGLDEAQVPLLDQVQERHPPAHIPLGDAHHQAQVGLDQLPPGLLVALLDPLGELHLFFRRQERDPSNLLQVHADRVIQAHVVGYGEVDGLRRLLFGLVVLLIGLSRLALLGRVGNDADAVLGEPLVNLINLLRGQIHMLESVHDLLVIERAVLAPPLHQGLDALQLENLIRTRHRVSPLSCPAPGTPPPLGGSGAGPYSTARRPAPRPPRLGVSWARTLWYRKSNPFSLSSALIPSSSAANNSLSMRRNSNTRR